MRNFDDDLVKKYLPLLSENKATGKNFDFNYEDAFKPGYLRNAVKLKNDSKNRAAVFTPPFLVVE